MLKNKINHINKIILYLCAGKCERYKSKMCVCMTKHYLARYEYRGNCDTLCRGNKLATRLFI